MQLKYEDEGAGGSALAAAANGVGLLYPRAQGAVPASAGGGPGAVGGGGKPVVVYASRTHAQLSQVWLYGCDVRWSGGNVT